MSDPAPVDAPSSHGTAADAAAGRQSRRRRRRLLTQEGVGAAALLLSLSLAGVGVWQAVRGSDIVVALEPREVYLYRDAGPRSAALSMAVRLPLVNRASADYGDVVTAVTASLLTGGSQSGPTFDYQSVVEPVFTDRDPRTLTSGCDVRVRCVAAEGLIAIERIGQLVDLPGGAARDQHFGFVLDQAYCRGPAGACAPFQNFESAVVALARAPATVAIDARFSGRRHRGVRCAIQLTRARADYLRDKGWVTLPCL